MEITLSGSPEELMQQLADLVSQQRREIDSMKHELTAMQFLVRDVLVPLLGNDAPLDQETWNEEVERARLFWAEMRPEDGASPEVAEAAAMAFAEIAETVDWFAHRGDQPGPRFTVIKGGLSD